MNTTREELQSKHAKALAALDAEHAIREHVPELPEGVRFTVSNIQADTRPAPNNVKAWLSFGGPAYDPDGLYDPIEVLSRLEGAGFELLTATLCKWNDYRCSPECGAIDDIPEEQARRWGAYKLSNWWPMAPCWITPCQHTEPELVCFMRCDGEIYRVSVDIPRSACRLQANRKEFLGGWSYERGSAKLTFPRHWHGLQNCTVHECSRAYVDTEQGISGRVYFSPHDDYTEWNQPASEFLRYLLATA